MKWFADLPAGTLTQISPLAAKSLAMSLGWKEQPCPYPDAWFLVADDDDTPSLLLPRGTDFADYPLRLVELVTAVSDICNRAPGSVLRDLLYAPQDIVRLRSLNAEENGNIDLDNCISFYENIRIMILSVAYSAWRPRAVHHFRRGTPEVARQFFFAPAETGSHIANLIMPTAAKMPRASSDEEPVHCRPAQMLDRALRAAMVAGQSAVLDDDFNHFAAGVGEGISANFCDSLAELMDRDRLTTINVRWSLTSKTPPGARGQHRLDSAISSVLRQAAKEFRSKEPRETESFEGSVIRLHREKKEKSGTVTLRLDIDERQRQVKVIAKDKLYKNLATAHRDGLRLLIKGDLREEAGHLHLFEPHLLETYPIED